MSVAKDLRRLLTAAERAGCRVIARGDRHTKVYGPNGGIAVLSATPSDGHYLKVARGCIRRNCGVEL